MLEPKIPKCPALDVDSPDFPGFGLEARCDRCGEFVSGPSRFVKSWAASHICEGQRKAETHAKE